MILQSCSCIELRCDQTTHHIEQMIMSTQLDVICTDQGMHVTEGMKYDVILHLFMTLQQVADVALW